MFLLLIDKKKKDVIEKSIMLESILSKIWQALVDYRKFGMWFCIKLDDPFIIGKKIRGYPTVAKFKSIEVEFIVKEIKFEQIFSYKWHPHVIDPKVDYSKEEHTLVEFKLKELPFKSRSPVSQNQNVVLSLSVKTPKIVINQGL